MRCESFDDFKTMILQNNIKLNRLNREKVRQGTLSQEQYDQTKQDALEKAHKQWEQLLKKNDKFYKKDGYLDIEYLADKNIYRRVPMGKGRPKQEQTKDKRVTIRLDEELIKILNKYCQTNNVTESEAIRKAIQQLKYIYGAK